MMRFCRNLALFAFFALVLPLQGASAITQCEVNISRIYSGDSGMIYLYYAQGGSGYMAATNPNKEAILAMAMTALVTGRSVTVRYTASGVNCMDSSRSDLEGMFLN